MDPRIVEAQVNGQPVAAQICGDVITVWAAPIGTPEEIEIDGVLRAIALTRFDGRSFTARLTTPAKTLSDPRQPRLESEPID